MSSEQALKVRLAAHAGGRVLDIACGRGDSVALLFELLHDFQAIVGIDTDAAALAQAGQRFTDARASFQRMDAARLEFPDASFDTLLISNSLHHMADLPQVLKEARRVLKPGGLFFVLEMYRDNPGELQRSHMLFHHWRAAVHRRQGTYHREIYLRTEILSIFGTLGLTQTEVFDLDASRDPPASTEQLGQILKQCDTVLEQLGDRPDAAELRAQGLAVRQRIAETGFRSCSELAILGRKPAAGG
jgi:ubiquinone/menaquinone biosynthesis C-methylase UbiE